MTLDTSTKADLLSRAPLFTSLAPDELSALADRAEVVEFERGRYIVSQGQIGTGFFLILEGRVRIARAGETLAELGPGEVLGELSVIDQQPRVANAIAEEATRCLALASWDLNAALAEHPQLAVALLRVVARRLRDATDHVTH